MVGHLPYLCLLRDGMMSDQVSHMPNRLTYSHWEWTRGTLHPQKRRLFILQFAMEPNRPDKKLKKAIEAKCKCMAAELVKLHYYDDALKNTEIDRDNMRDKWEGEKIQQISRDATAEQIRQGLLLRISHGWTIEGEMRDELAQVTREWQASMAIVGRLQRRVNNLVDLGEGKDRKLIVAEHNLLHSETSLRTLNGVCKEHEDTIQMMKTRFVDMRSQRDHLKTERDSLMIHYEQVIRELNAEIDNNSTEEE